MSSFITQEAEPLRDRNLEAFEKYQPVIHGRLLDHVPISRLEIDEDGVADTVFNDQYFYNKKTEQYVADQLRAFWKKPPQRPSMKEPPRRSTSTTLRNGKFLHNLLLRSTELGMEFAPRPVTEETYFLLIFGVGLGGHIDPLVERVNCHVLILVEPSLEFIYHSLEVYDWTALFERFEERNGRVKYPGRQQPGRPRPGRSGSTCAGRTPARLTACTCFRTTTMPFSPRPRSS